MDIFYSVVTYAESEAEGPWGALTSLPVQPDCLETSSIEKPDMKVFITSLYCVLMCWQPTLVCVCGSQNVVLEYW